MVKVIYNTPNSPVKMLEAEFNTREQADAWVESKNGLVWVREIESTGSDTLRQVYNLYSPKDPRRG